MSYEYRVIRLKSGKIGVHEVYYTVNNMLSAWTPHPMPLQGETKEQLEKNFEAFKTAFEKPILEEEQLIQDLIKASQAPPK